MKPFNRSIKRRRSERCDIEKFQKSRRYIGIFDLYIILYTEKIFWYIRLLSSEFAEDKKTAVVVLIVVYKETYLLVIVLVYNLSLAISLGVKCSKKLNLNPKDIVEFIPEIWYKLGTTVRDN